MSNWQPQSAGDLPDGLILFDGVCVLCSGWVNFIIPRDKDRHFRFVAIQSEAGTVLARRFGIDPVNPETVAVTAGGLAHFKGDAPLAVWHGLPGWRWTVMFRIVPHPVRDFLYDRIARNRYRLFGKHDSCMVPTPDIRSRFISNLPDLANAA